MNYQYLINHSAPHNPPELRFQTMRVGALTPEILKAKVDNYLNNGWELATDEQVIADRGALLETSEAEEKAEAEQEVNNGNTSVEAVEANAEVGNQGQDESEAAAEDAPAEAETPAEEAPVEESVDESAPQE